MVQEKWYLWQFPNIVWEKGNLYYRTNQSKFLYFKINGQTNINLLLSMVNFIYFIHLNSEMVQNL